MVSELEQREAAVYTHTPWPDYEEFDWYDKAQMVAHYRIHLLIDMHVQDASEKYSESQVKAHR